MPETRFHGKCDAARETGPGLYDLAVGVRWRYKIRREFAHYIRIERSGKFGGTVDFARADGKPTMATRIGAGLRCGF